MRPILVNPNSATGISTRGSSAVKTRDSASKLPSILGKLIAVAGAALAAIWWAKISLIWVYLVVVSAATLRKILAERKSRLEIQAAKDDIARGCALLAGQLKAGQPPWAAINQIARESTVFAKIASALEITKDIPTALSQVGSSAKYGEIYQLSQTWWVCQYSGSPISDAVAAIVQQQRNAKITESSIQLELSSARTTAMLLAGLPAVGVLMGFAVGGNPIEFLGQTAAGQICLAAAFSLVALGLLWAQKLTELPNDDFGNRKAQLPFAVIRG